MKGFLVATAFLTRVPLPVQAGAGDVGRAARWFPLVGTALGGAAALAAWGLHDLLRLPPALCALVLVACGAWVTGAIHLDGLADVADGFGGGGTRDDVLRIMRDPAIGSYGAVALLLVMGIKVAALATLMERDAALPFLVAAPALARWTIVALAEWLPYARAEGGLGQAVTDQRDITGWLLATVMSAVVTTAALKTASVTSWAIAVLMVTAIGRTARARIGGVTGDVFGASVELTETSVLLGGVLLTGRP